jgi:hypothetical protein
MIVWLLCLLALTAEGPKFQVATYDSEQACIESRESILKKQGQPPAGMGLSDCFRVFISTAKDKQL